MAAGAEVLAVEPDSHMARVASAKGVSVEVATFEQWEPTDRSFDLVVFAQSFHWVDPKHALHKVAALLNPGGRAALLWNRITPVTPTRQQLDEAYAGLLEHWQRPSVDFEGGAELAALLDEAGLHQRTPPVRRAAALPHRRLGGHGDHLLQRAHP
jgi:SAM-dependent methyltransferase